MSAKRKQHRIRKILVMVDRGDENARHTVAFFRHGVEDPTIFLVDPNAHTIGYIELLGYEPHTKVHATYSRSVISVHYTITRPSKR